MSITFGYKDYEGVQFLHNNALVIMPLVTNFNIKKVLVNNCSSIDILLYDAFEKVEINPNYLHPTHSVLKGFSREAILLTITFL